MNLNLCVISRATRPWRTGSRRSILWLLILLLGGGFANRLVAQVPAPLRVEVETEGDRRGNCCQVVEGDSIRVFLTAKDGRTGDPAVEVRWRLYAKPCDGGHFDVLPIQESSTWVQAGDPERALEIPAPDDWVVQTTNRCLSLVVDFPGLVAPATRYEWTYTLLGNETRFPEGVTAWMPDFTSFTGVPFVAAPDGSAYFIRDLSDYPPSGTVVRLQPDLSPDPSFQPQLPAGFQVYGLEALPDGGVVVVGSPAPDVTTLMKLDIQGTRDRTFQPEGLTNGVSTVKADASGRLYVSDVRRLLRLRTDGTIDPDFAAPSFSGWIGEVWAQGDHVYVGGDFKTVAGLAATHVAVFRLHAVTGIDPSFSLSLATNQSSISQLVETTDGKVITYGRPLLRTYSGGGQLLSESIVDGSWSCGFPLTCDGGNSYHWSWGSLARLDGGMVVGSSKDSDCDLGGCRRSVRLESFETGNPSSDATRTIPNLKSSATGRLVSAGNFLWAEERGENRIRFRRYRFYPPTADSFGFLESKEFITPASPWGDRGTIRRFGNSERRVELRLRVQLLETDSTLGFEPFTTSVVMEPGDVAKPILLPAAFRPSPNSVSRLRAELLPANGVTVDGSGSIEFFVAGVEPSPNKPVLAVHKFRDGPWLQRVLVTLSGPAGRYTIQISPDGLNWWARGNWDGNTDNILLGSDHFAGVAESNLLTHPWFIDNEPGMLLFRVVRAP